MQPQVRRPCCECPFELALPFLGEPAGLPEAAQRAGQRRPGRVAGGMGVVEGGTEVVVLAQQDAEPAFPLGQR